MISPECFTEAGRLVKSSKLEIEHVVQWYIAQGAVGC